jgi:Malectin domain
VTVLKEVDIYVEAFGAYKPIKRTFTTTVVDGFLSIVAKASLSGAVISGIEVNELPAIRINVGSNTSWTDPITSYKWDFDQYYDTNGRRFLTKICPLKINNTLQDTLYCNERIFPGKPGTNSSYTIPVLARGQYRVNLFFVETSVTTANVRVFNIYVQNNLIRSKFDIYATAGNRSKEAVTVSTLASVTSASDLNIRIRFVNVIQNSKISAIEIIPTRTSNPPTNAPVRTLAPISTFAPTNAISVVRINAGSQSPWTDPITNQVWMADRYFNALGRRFVFCPLVVGNTEQDDLYCSERYI